MPIETASTLRRSPKIPIYPKQNVLPGEILSSSDTSFSTGYEAIDSNPNSVSYHGREDHKSSAMGPDLQAAHNHWNDDLAMVSLQVPTGLIVLILPPSNGESESPS